MLSLRRMLLAFKARRASAVPGVQTTMGVTATALPRWGIPVVSELVLHVGYIDYFCRGRVREIRGGAAVAS